MDRKTPLLIKFTGVPKLLKSSVNVPAFTVSVPVKVFTAEPLSVNAPRPVFVKAVPATTVLMVAA